jgi:hypothetical protein
MNARSIGTVLALGIALALPAAGQGFTGGLSPEDFAAAGLGKLTPEERAKLDALVAAGGSVRGLPRETGGAAPVPTATKRVSEESAPAPGTARLRIGTKVEYVAEESEIEGVFRGFSVGTIFRLKNGSAWRVVGNSYDTGPDPAVKKVRIQPGSLGSTFLIFEGVSIRAKVEPLRTVR